MFSERTLVCRKTHRFEIRIEVARGEKGKGGWRKRMFLVFLLSPRYPSSFIGSPLLPSPSPLALNPRVSIESKLQSRRIFYYALFRLQVRLRSLIRTNGTNSSQGRPLPWPLVSDTSIRGGKKLANYPRIYPPPVGALHRRSFARLLAYF